VRLGRGGSGFDPALAVIVSIVKAPKQTLRGREDPENGGLKTHPAAERVCSITAP
jgi:hypothetical protein